jgi:N-acetylmuramoyl-L-alanine amidase
MPTSHEIRQGECLSSIAAQYGFLWETIWNHGDNAGLKTSRKDPNVLMPGDVLVIPDKADKVVARPTGQRHVFKTTLKPTTIKIRLTLDDQPRSGLAYELVVDGESLKGSTDGDGCLTAEIPATAQGGRLVVGDKEPRETYELAFGTLDPIDTTEGIEERLRSLGLNTEGGLSGAIATFQLNNQMDVTGAVDDAFKAKLKEKFGQ